MVQGVWSENLEQQIDATTQFRKLLSIGEHADARITDLLPLQRTSLVLNATVLDFREKPTDRRGHQSGSYPALCAVSAASGCASTPSK